MVISLAGEWDIYRREELQGRLEPALSEDQVILPKAGFNGIAAF